MTEPALVALFQVILIDITLAGDNAVVIGMVAASVRPELRKKIIFWGLAAAVVLRIGLALIAVQLLTILGLAIAGGLLLLWVAWRLYRQLRKDHSAEEASVATIAGVNGTAAAAAGNYVPMNKAIFQVVVADISMSLDNVLAVAGAARDHAWVLAIGLLLSIALTAVAATIIARLLHRYPWIAYVGLLIIVYVALKMIWDGGEEVLRLI
ncbi:MAG: YjbE family putative metal transport protein [Alphaproteobacteria bacterium]